MAAETPKRKAARAWQSAAREARYAAPLDAVDEAALLQPLEGATAPTSLEEENRQLVAAALKRRIERGNRPPPDFPQPGTVFFKDAEQRAKFQEATGYNDFCGFTHPDGEELLRLESRKAWLMMLENADDQEILSATYLSEYQLQRVRERFQHRND